MDPYKADKIYKEAIELWGYDSQVRMWHEEAGELMQAVSKYNRKPTDENFDHLCEEIVDVKILTAQLEAYMPDDRIKYWFDFKMSRLENRIEAGKEKRAQNQNISIEEFLSDFKTMPKLSKIEINSIINELIVIQNSL
jgi:NTP pyrophosphatase (non-canonical NTP hydrolase)